MYVNELGWLKVEFLDRLESMKESQVQCEVLPRKCKYLNVLLITIYITTLILNAEILSLSGKSPANVNMTGMVWLILI